jgi:hypothetical protein
MGAGTTTTLFVNKTGHAVKMQVGNSQYFSDLTSIKEGGEYKLSVNMNDTYREFAVVSGQDGSSCSKKEIVSSDDCCEFQCITIQEATDGTGIELLRQPRDSVSHTSDTGSSSAS